MAGRVVVFNCRVYIMQTVVYSKSNLNDDENLLKLCLQTVISGLHFEIAPCLTTQTKHKATVDQSRLGTRNISPEMARCVQ